MRYYLICIKFLFVLLSNLYISIVVSGDFDAVFKKNSILDQSFSKEMIPDYDKIFKKKINQRPLEFKLNELFNVRQLREKFPESSNETRFILSGERGSGGGGDILVCENKDGSGYEIFSLDYFRNTSKELQRNFQKKTCVEVISEVYNKLTDKSPLLAVGLKDYIQTFSSLSIVGKRSFVFQSSDLFLIRDERLQSKIPENCAVIQAGIRQPLPETIHYSIDIDILESLKREPVQCSHFILHEWARDFIKDADKIALFVNYLHTDQFFYEEQMKYPGIKNEAAKYLRKIKKISQKEYNNFMTNYGFGPNSLDIVKNNLALFEGNYVSTQSKINRHRVSVDKDNLLINFEISGQVFNFKCDGYNCMNTNISEHLQLELQGFFNVITVRFLQDNQIVSLSTFIKEEYFDEFSRLTNETTH